MKKNNLIEQTKPLEELPQSDGRDCLVRRIKDYYNSDQFRVAAQQKEEMFRRICGRLPKDEHDTPMEFFDHLPLPLYRTTPGGDILMANFEMAKLLGYDSVEAIKGVKSLTFYVDAEDRKRWQEAVEERQVVQDYEVEWRRCDGKRIFVRNSTRAVYDDAGVLQYYEGAVKDVTELREKDCVFQKVFRKLPVGALLLNDRGEITSVNDHALRILDYPADAVTGRYLWDFLRERDQLKCRRLVGARLKGLKPPVERLYRTFVRRDGSLVATKVRAEVVGEGDRITGILCTLEDISVTRDLVQYLSVSGSGIPTLFENIPVPVFIKDMWHRFTYGNFRFRVELGVSQDCLMGKRDNDFYPAELASRYQEDDRRAFRGEVFDTIEQHKPPGLAEPGAVQVLKFPVLNRDGKTIGVCGIYWDVVMRDAVVATLRNAKADISDSFNRISSAAANAIYRCRPDGRFIQVNPACARMFGYATPRDLVSSVDDAMTELYAEPERRGDFLAKLSSPPWEVHNARFRAFRRIPAGGRRVVNISENVRAVRGVNNRLEYYEGFVREVPVDPHEEFDGIEGDSSGIPNAS